MAVPPYIKEKLAVYYEKREELEKATLEREDIEFAARIAEQRIRLQVQMQQQTETANKPAIHSYSSQNIKLACILVIAALVCAFFLSNRVLK